MKKLLLTFLIILLIVNISAFEFDNVKRYDTSSRTITIENAFGLGEDIASAKLLTPTIYQVPLGYQKVAEIEVQGYTDYSEFLSKLELFNKNNNLDKFERVVDYKYLTTEEVDVPEYINVCEKTINGTSYCYNKQSGTKKVIQNVWKPLEKLDILNGQKLTIGLFTNVEKDDNVEWIPTLFGVDVEEWATWTASLTVGLRAYYNFSSLDDSINNASNGLVKDGAVGNIISNSSCLNNGVDTKCMYFSGTSNVWLETKDNNADLVFNLTAVGFTDYTVNGWVRKTGTGNYVFIGKGDTSVWQLRQDSDDQVTVNINGVQTVTNIMTNGYTTNTWKMWTLTVNATKVCLYINGTNVNNCAGINYAQSSTSPIGFGGVDAQDGNELVGYMDEWGFWNRTLSQDEITTLFNEGSGLTYPIGATSYAPTVTLITPANNIKTSNSSLFFNCTATDDYKINNVSLYINNLLNETLIYGTDNKTELTKTITNLGEGNYNWTCSAYDNETKIGFPTNRTFIIDRTNPQVTINSGNGTQSFGYNGLNQTINFTVTDSNIDKCILEYPYYNSENKIENVTYNFSTNGQDKIYINITDGSSTNLLYRLALPTNCTDETYTVVYRNYTKDGFDYRSNFYCRVSATENNTLLSYLWGTIYPLTINEVYFGKDVGCSSGVSNITNISIVQNKYTARLIANDSANNLNISTINWDYSLFLNNNIYETNVYETSTKYFFVNTSYNSTKYLSVGGNIIYNGVSYSATNVGGTGYLIFNKSLIIPSVTADTNVSFYWNFFVNDGSTTSYVNTSLYNQTILNLQSINVTNITCSAGFFPAINFTFYDEKNFSLLTPNIKINIKYGIGNSTSNENNYSWDSLSSLRICVNSSQSEYKVGYAELEYQETDYVSRRYYLFSNYTLSNSTTDEIKVYDLYSSDATSFLFEAKNTELTPYVNKFLSLLRWYPNLNEYRVVERAKTDENGRTIMKVKAEDVDYRVGLYHLNGSLIKIAEPVRMACLVNPCTYTLIVAPSDANNLVVLNNIESSIDYNETLSRFTFIWNDPSGLTNSMRLIVYKETGYQNIVICNSTSTGSTGAIVCSTAGYTGLFHAVAYRTASPEVILGDLYSQVSDMVESDFGLFLTIIISLTAGLIGVFSPVGAVITVIIGLIPSLAFGSINLTIFMSIVALGGIIIHYLRKV